MQIKFCKICVLKGVIKFERVDGRPEGVSSGQRRIDVEYDKQDVNEGDLITCRADFENLAPTFNSFQDTSIPEGFSIIEKTLREFQPDNSMIKLYIYIYIFLKINFDLSTY